MTEPCEARQPIAVRADAPRRARRARPRRGSGALPRRGSAFRWSRCTTSPADGIRARSWAPAAPGSSCSSRPRSDTGVARFLESRGPGLHHICFEVPDLAATLDGLAADGFELVDPRPRRGAHGPGRVHPSAQRAWRTGRADRGAGRTGVAGAGLRAPRSDPGSVALRRQALVERSSTKSMKSRSPGERPASVSSAAASLRCCVPWFTRWIIVCQRGRPSQTALTRSSVRPSRKSSSAAHSASQRSRRSAGERSGSSSGRGLSSRPCQPLRQRPCEPSAWTRTPAETALADGFGPRPRRLVQALGDVQDAPRAPAVIGEQEADLGGLHRAIVARRRQPR